MFETSDHDHVLDCDLAAWLEATADREEHDTDARW